MARFVLLHSPLLGPACWRGVAGELARLGHRAETPAWPPLLSLETGYYGPMAEAVARQVEGGEPALLVAHSGAGALVPVLTARLGDVAGAVFVDAILPHPGRSWFDTAPQGLRDSLTAGVQHGLLPAWPEWWPPGALARLVPDAAVRQALIAETAPIPAAYLQEPAPLGEPPARSAYLKLSEAYEDEARLANRRGWPLLRLPLDHLAPVTRPDAVAAALSGLAERLGEAGP